MSASITPTLKPSAASAAARLVVTVDLPTPPLPLATISTLVVGGMAVSGARCDTLKRALAMAAAFSSAVSSAHTMRTLVTPGRDSSRALTSFWIWALSGQPEVVRAISTRTNPSSDTCAPRAMPNSTRLLPSSGSTTPRISSMTASAVGAVVVTVRCYRGGCWADPGHR